MDVVQSFNNDRGNEHVPQSFMEKSIQGHGPDRDKLGKARGNEVILFQV